MKPHSIGRTLGIGLRVAGRIAGQQVAASGQGAATANSVPNQSAQARTASQNAAHAGKTAGVTTRAVARGVGGFLRPFGRVGHILWLEVMGAFFFLPVVVFAPTLWRIRASWLRGPEHSTFLITAAIMALFFYLSLSSFWRARKK
jgi:cation transport ATPase